MSQFKSIEQQRAAIAWQHIQDLDSVSDEYLSLVRGISAMVVMNGFGQTLAFLLAKGTGGNHHQKLARHLADWLLRDKAEKGPRTPAVLMEKIMENDHKSYRQLRGEGLAYLVWLKRFAEARRKMDDSDNGETVSSNEEGTA